LNALTKLQVRSLLQRAQAEFHAAAYGEARVTSRHVLELDLNNADAYHMLGAIATQEKNFAEAETLLAKAISMNRRSPHFFHTLGNVYRAQANYESAEAAYRRALKLDPGLSAAYIGLAAALRALGRSHAAVVYLQRYLQREPNDADGYNELGLTFKDLGKLDLALEQLRTALRINPDHQRARDNTAIVLLLAENFRDGWPAWIRSFTKAPFPDPGTQNAPFDGKRVVIYPNEGVGDEIMYASCLAKVIRHAAEITLYCDRRLASLFQRSFPSIRTFGTAKESVNRIIGMIAPDEIHIPASFLPAYFPPNVDSFTRRKSFLVANPALVSKWRERFDALGSGLKIGISWQGGVDPINRSQRSIPLSAWSSILAVQGVHFVNLQYGAVGAEIEQARTTAPIHGWSDANPLIDLDFFAAQIAALDLVISVSNTTVHMAGALGIPVWALLHLVPDWRWKMAGTTTHWYPSVQLFRQQEAGQWGSVLRQIEMKLATCAAASAVDTS